MNMVYVIIPAHNNKKEVIEVLTCLHKQTYKYINLILIDDGSYDGTEEEVKKFFPKVKILKGNGNLWWTGANILGVNYVLRKAKDDDFILLLNNDLIVNEDYIENLVNASNSNNRAIVGSTLVDYINPDFMEGGIKIDKNLNIFVNRDKENIENTDIEFNIDVLPGRGTLIPIEVFKKIGNFNFVKLPHYGADYEFTYRAKRNNFNLIVSHKARVFAKLNITGLNTNKKILSFKECFDLLFSKKSKTNIIYYLNYVWLCSDEKYRVKNLISNLIGILRNTLFKTLCFYFLLISFSRIKFLFIFILRIFFGPYYLKEFEIEKYGFTIGELMEKRVIEMKIFRSKRFYYFRPDIDLWIKMLPKDEKDNFFKLKNLSCNFLHKISILMERISK